MPRLHSMYPGSTIGHNRLTQGWLPLCPKCSPGLLSSTSTSLKVTFDAKVNVRRIAATEDVVFLRANFLESQGSFTRSLHDPSSPTQLCARARSERGLQSGLLISELGRSRLVPFVVESELTDQCGRLAETLPRSEGKPFILVPGPPRAVSKRPTRGSAAPPTPEPRPGARWTPHAPWRQGV